MTSAARTERFASDEERRAARGLVTAVRALCDRVIRLAAGPQSAGFARQVERLVDDMDSHVGPELTPWFYGTMQPAPAEGGRVRDPLSAYHPMVPPLRFSIEGTEGHGRVRVGPAFTGPPGRVHGGTISTILDHAMGMLVATAVQPSVTAHLEVDFLRAVPVDEELDILVRVQDANGRKTWVDAEVLHEDRLCARGRALFVAP